MKYIQTRLTCPQQPQHYRRPVPCWLCSRARSRVPSLAVPDLWVVYRKEKPGYHREEDGPWRTCSGVLRLRGCWATGQCVEAAVSVIGGVEGLVCGGG